MSPGESPPSTLEAGPGQSLSSFGDHGGYAFSLTDDPHG